MVRGTGLASVVTPNRARVGRGDRRSDIRVGGGRAHRRRRRAVLRVPVGTRWAGMVLMNGIELDDCHAPGTRLQAWLASLIVAVGMWTVIGWIVWRLLNHD